MKTNVKTNMKTNNTKLIKDNIYGKDSKMKVIRISLEVEKWLNKRAKTNMRSANAEIFAILKIMMEADLDQADLGK